MGHGKFLCWIAAEFDWSKDTAQRLMRVHDLISENGNLRNLKVPISAFDLRAAPSVPDRALVEIARRVGAADGLSLNAAKQIILNTRRMSPVTPICVGSRGKLCAKSGKCRSALRGAACGAAARRPAACVTF